MLLGLQTRQTEEFDCLEKSIKLIFLFLKEAQLSILVAKHYEGNKYKITSISLAILTLTSLLSLWAYNADLL